jgi:MarR family transcriptional regulator for hemolysin
VLAYDFQESITYWVCMTARALERALNEELAPHGITMQQAGVLGWLALEGDLSPSQLAERLQVEPPTLVGILDRMERDGWVERLPAPDDRRKKLVRPTPRVQPVWAQIATCGRRVRARATRGLSPQELERVKSALALVQKNLS